MTGTLNSHGLKPMRFWKFAEVDDWQVLVYVQENEDRADQDDLVIETAFEMLGERSSIKISGPQATIAKLFESIVPADALQGLLDTLAPALAGEFAADNAEPD